MGQAGIAVVFGAGGRGLLARRLRTAPEHRQGDRGSASRAARPRLAPAIVMGLLVLVSGCGGGGGTGAAVSSNLGAPTSDVPDSYQGLDGFTRVGGAAQRHGKVPVTMLDALWDGASAVDRWAIVKALGQFGTWSGLQGTTATIPLRPPEATGSGAVIYFPPTPTFNFSHARYRSRYVAFMERVLQTRPHRAAQHVPPSALVEFARDSRLREEAFPEAQSTTPVVVVGTYAMHGAYTAAESVAGGYVTTGQGAGSVPSQETFAGVQRMLQRGDVAATWVSDFNGYVNVVTTLICAQDGKRPAKACDRKAIGTILKAVR